MLLPLQRRGSAARLPSRPTEGSLYVVEASEGAILGPGQVAKIPTGLAFEVPSRHHLFLRETSSLALRGLQIVGGVLGSDFTGRLYVHLRNNGRESHVVRAGDGVAKLELGHDLLAGFETLPTIDELFGPPDKCRTTTT